MPEGGITGLLRTAEWRASFKTAGRSKKFMLYTVARPTPEVFATRLEADELEALAAVIRAQTGLVVKTFA